MTTHHTTRPGRATADAATLKVGSVPVRIRPGAQQPHHPEGQHVNEQQTPETRPARGDQFAAWLKAHRDVATSWSAWRELDHLLDQYRRLFQQPAPADRAAVLTPGSKPTPPPPTRTSSATTEERTMTTRYEEASEAARNLLDGLNGIELAELAAACQADTNRLQQELTERHKQNAQLGGELYDLAGNCLRVARRLAPLADALPPTLADLLKSCIGELRAGRQSRPADRAEFPRGFRLHHRGRVLDGVEFPSARCIVVDDPHDGLASAATSLEHLLLNYIGARIEWPVDEPAAVHSADTTRNASREH
jgi:hypothetical protein